MVTVTITKNWFEPHTIVGYFRGPYPPRIFKSPPPRKVSTYVSRVKIVYVWKLCWIKNCEITIDKKIFRLSKHLINSFLFFEVGSKEISGPICLDRMHFAIYFTKSLRYDSFIQSFYPKSLYESILFLSNRCLFSAQSFPTKRIKRFDFWQTYKKKKKSVNNRYDS